MKVYVDDFLPIGFYLDHKQKALEELAEKTKDHGKNFCNPLSKKIRKKNPKHPDEDNELLPPEIRGKHYNSYWQICKDLGCYMYRNQEFLDDIIL